MLVNLKADNSIVLQAIETSRPEAIEFGIPLLGDRFLADNWPVIVKATSHVTDPWALDVLLQRTYGLSTGVRNNLVLAMEPLLRDVILKGEKEHKWTAMGLLWSAGKGQFDVLPQAEMDVLFEKAKPTLSRHIRIPVEAVRAALDALGEKVEDYLIVILSADHARQLETALFIMPYYGGRKTIEALISCLDSDGKKWNYWRPFVVLTLAKMTGQRFGNESGPWRDWVMKQYGRP